MNTLINRYKKKGISISLRGGADLSVKPLNLLSEEDKDQISENKAAIVNYLKSLPEDPASPILRQLGWRVQYVVDDVIAKAAVDELVAMGEAVFGLDIETYGPSERQGKVLFQGGLDPYLGRIRSIQIAARNRQVVVFDLATVNPQNLMPLMQGRGVFVAYNAAFEYSFLKGIGLVPRRLDCAMLMARLAFGLSQEGDRYLSLAETTQRLLGIEIEKEMRGSDWSAFGSLSTAQVNYGALDAVLAYVLVQPLSQKIAETDQGKIYRLIRRALPVVQDVMLNGIGFDAEAHARLIREWSQAFHDAFAEIQKSLSGIKSPNSAKQVSQWLEENLPEEILEGWPRTEKGQLKTGASELSDWPDCPEVIKRYKEYNKLSTTYGQGFADHIHPVTGRIHANFALMGTRGGRFSCSKPNIQNPPRRAEFRQLFVPTSGYEFVVADFSQIELRVCAIIADDWTMKNAYREGIDLHRLTAAHAAGCDLKEVTDEQRQAAKAINFGLIYGMSAITLVQYAWNNYRVRMSLEEAQAFRHSFFENYRGIARWHEAVKQRGQWDQTVTTQTGLIRDLGKEAYGWKFTNACNTPVQGSAAEVLLASLARLSKALTDLNARIVNHVHDEILIECSIKEISKAKEVLVQAMTAGFLEVFPENTDMTRDLVEAKSGSNWYSAKQGKG